MHTVSVAATCSHICRRGRDVGVFLGDEIMDSGTGLENFSSAAAFVRETWPEAIIYANEGLNVMLTGGFVGTAATAHLPAHTRHNGWISDDPNWKLPPELDL